jgi:IS5 family transposase
MMGYRRVGQLSLADSLVRSRSRSSQLLDRLEQVVDWPSLSEELSGLRAGGPGAPSYPPLMMLKALLLAQWYGLADEALEDALNDRVSFRRFIGLSLDERAPDHSTLWRFREELGRRQLSQRLFAAVAQQIDAKGLILREGTVIDATLVAARAKRPAKPQNPPGGTPSEPGERPPSQLTRSPADPDAGWTRKAGQLFFGYKGAVGMDLTSGFIRRTRLTGAEINDTVVADALIVGDEKSVWADKAYACKARSARLRAAGIKDRIMRRGNKHHPLPERAVRRNTAIGRRRGAVERVFAELKEVFGWRRVRYFGLARNSTHFELLCTALNLRRLVAATT